MVKRISVLAAIGFGFVSVQAQTWNLATGGSWNTAANWNPANIPNAVGASVTFNGAATVNNPAQTASRTITLDGSKTVGSILFNTDLSTFANTISTGTGGPLVFDEVGAGPSIITTTGGGTGNNTISVAMTFNDDVVANVNNTTASSGAGSLNLTGAIGGAGGFTKNGDGLATFGTGGKTYTGATVINGGRMRISNAAAPTSTSSFTINSGGQVDFITAGTYTLGGGTMNLNGNGPTTGPFSAFPGAIRNETGIAVTINNAVNLQSDTVIHVQGAAAGVTTFAGNVSGIGKLTLTAQPHNADLGTLTLNGANSYSGGTVVDGGTLLVSGANASLGSGNVTVDSANVSFSGSSAKLSIATGVLNAISDTATLSLAGGNAAGTADDGYADLGTGINEIVGALILGGVAQGPGTYGSTSSGATFQDNEYFSGSGMITVVPEPGTAVLVLAGLGMALRLKRAGRQI